MESYSDAQTTVQLSEIDGLANPRKPTVAFNAEQLAWHEVEAVERKARCKSAPRPNMVPYTAPGPNRVPYMGFKRCPKVFKILHWRCRRHGGRGERGEVHTQGVEVSEQKTYL